jgi:replicative DNA helicase
MGTPSDLTTAVFSPEAEMSVLGGMLIGGEEALSRAASMLSAEMFVRDEHQRLFGSLVKVWQRGEAVDEITISNELKSTNDFEKVGGIQLLASLLDAVPYAANIEYHCKIVREKYQAREVVRIGSGMAEAVRKGKFEPQRILDHALGKLVGLMSATAPDRDCTPESLVTGEIERMNTLDEDRVVVPLPYRKLRAQVGDLVPGDAVGVIGFSNSGKTNFVTNLCGFWTLRDIHQDWYPTESMERFFSRIASNHARVSQMFAERDAWELATQEEKEAYELAVRDLGRMTCWNLIPRANITAEEIIAESMMRRRRRKNGEVVVVVVDHMHRLNHGDRDRAMAVMDDTKRLRDWAKNSTIKGDPTILVLLYQPRKPPVDVAQYMAPGLYSISGRGEITAELDIIMSLYRRWVKTESGVYTPWGTPRARMVNGRPVAAKPESEGAKVDDEHVYNKLVKRRTGGEGHTVMLPIDSPSGYIYQVEAHASGLYAATA